MPGKPKTGIILVLLADGIAEARRINAQQMLLERFRIAGAPTCEDKSALRTYISSLTLVLPRERRLIEEAEAKKVKANSKAGTKNAGALKPG